MGKNGEEYENWDEFDEDEDQGEEQEQEADDALAAMKKEQRRRQNAKDEDSQAVGTIVTAFLKDATPEQVELAEIFLDGCTTPSQTRRAIDKIKARAAKLNPQDNIQPPAGSESDESDEDEDEDDKEFAPPAAGAPITPQTKQDQRRKALVEASRAGNRKAQFELFMGAEAQSGQPPQEEDANLKKFLGNL